MQCNELMSALDCFSIIQHVTFATHSRGHILDLIYTSDLFNILVTGSDFAFSDHKLFIIYLIYQYLSVSIRASTLSDCLLSQWPSEICSVYNNAISQVLEACSCCLFRPHVSPWFTLELLWAIKAKGHRLERLYRKTGLTVHSLQNNWLIWLITIQHSLLHDPPPLLRTLLTDTNHFLLC